MIYVTTAASLASICSFLLERPMMQGKLVRIHAPSPLCGYRDSLFWVILIPSSMVSLWVSLRQSDCDPSLLDRPSGPTPSSSNCDSRKAVQRLLRSLGGPVSQHNESPARVLQKPKRFDLRDRSCIIVFVNPMAGGYYRPVGRPANPCVSPSYGERFSPHLRVSQR